MLLSFFGGKVRIKTTSKPAAVLNALARLDVQYRHLVRAQDGSLSFSVPMYRKKAVCSLLCGIGADFEVVSSSGLPYIVSLYRRRWAIPAAAVMFFLMVAVSSRLIWSVDVTGNSVVPAAEIKEVLAQLGCGVGSYVRGIETDTLHNEFLLQMPDIAWISVNIDGTHANVEVRETMRAAPEDDGLYNVVAAEDGQIELISAFEGKAQVKLGDTVREGELLLSGVIDYRENQLRYESADGEVYARVNRSFTAEAPFEKKEKEETGRKICKKRLKIFGFSVNLFINSGISYMEYDTIYSEKQVTLFDRVELPVWIESNTSREYITKAVTLSENEARTEATAQYRRKLSEAAADVQVLEKKTTHEVSDGAYRIHCELYCLANIAKRVPISAE